MKIKSISLMLLLAVLFVFSPQQESKAAAPYYEGKTINLICGFAPGGGYDLFVRPLARILPKYIPGNPTIVVQNMPTAGSMGAANHLFNVAKPDGLTFGIFNRGLIFSQLLQADGVRFDVRKYSWLGSASVENATLALRGDLPFKTLDDILKSKEVLKLGGTGASDINNQFLLCLQDFLNINLKIATYKSGAEVMLAIERKELDGRGSSITSISNFVDRGILRPWIRGRTSLPEIEHLPIDEDLTTDKMGKTLMAMRSSVDVFGRSFAAPPNTPAELMNILRDALAKSVKDPALVDQANKDLFAGVQYVSAADCMKALDYVFTQPADTTQALKKYVQF
ncbi:MAG: tripartite tricarboxylate transporter substrate-binding protein [Syntrophaceae bacterium]|nr:tripartite tricarboxylate transporter substrate-binding protein [Syntrophaceae bacterium]